MNKILIIIGHPNYTDSIANKAIINAFSAKINELSEHYNLSIRNLIQLYPNYKIDKNAEQEALLWADTVIFQFPFYWYSVPAILKLWIDEVLEYGFAYGKTGDKMKGKNLVLSFSTGGPKEAYSSTGYNNYEIEDLLKPFIQTSNLMGTNFIKPVTSNAMMYIPNVFNSINEIESKAINHANELFKCITKL